MSDNLISGLFLRDPEAANLMRRRALAERLMTSQAQQPLLTPTATYGQIAQNLAGALMDWRVGQQQDDLMQRRRAEDAEYSRNNPNPLFGLFGGGGSTPAAPASAPAMPPAQGDAPPRAIPAVASASLPAPTLPNGRPDFSRMADSAPAPEGQGFDPRARNQEFAALRERAHSTLTGDALAAELARISSMQAQSGSGLVAGASYRRPEHGVPNPSLPPDRDPVRLWQQAGPAAAPSGAVPAFNGGAPQAIPVQATPPGQGAPAAPPRIAPPTPASSGPTQSQAQAAAMALMQQAEAAERNPNPLIQQRAAGLRQQAQMALSLARQEAPDRELIRVRRADGSEIFVPRAQAQGMVSAPERPQPSERERAQERYIQLSIAARSRQLSPQEQAQLALDAQTLEGNPQVVAGPGGIGIVPPRQLPLGGGSQGAPQGAPGAIPVQAVPPGGADAVPGTAPAPTQRAPQQVPIPGRGTAQFIPAEQPAAQQPTPVIRELTGGVTNIRRARDALALATQRPESFGAWQGMANMAPGVLERADPGGVDARAAAANLGSLIIHERSGAAVTAAEFPRLRPFIPQVGDPPVVQTKIRRFIQEYEDELRTQYEMFGPSAGFRSLTPVEEILRGSRIAGPGGQGSAEPPGQSQVIEFDRNGRRVRR